MKSCPPTPPDCGLLHDKLSLLWGDYKDKVDELQMEMNKNDFEWEELKFNLNDQIKILGGTKARFSMQLAEARSNMAADRAEKKEKEVQKSELDHDYELMMKACKKRISWIFSRTCVPLLLSVTLCWRRAPYVHQHPSTTAMWMLGYRQSACDDACPDKNDPYACGGWQQIT